MVNLIHLFETNNVRKLTNIHNDMWPNMWLKTAELIVSASINIGSSLLLIASVESLGQRNEGRIDVLSGRHLMMMTLIQVSGQMETRRTS